MNLLLLFIGVGILFLGGGRVYINHATYEELMSLPYITSDEALIILMERERGPYRSFDDFKRRVPLEPYLYDILEDRLAFDLKLGSYRFSLSSEPVLSGYLTYKRKGIFALYSKDKLTWSAFTEEHVVDYLRLGRLSAPFLRLLDYKGRDGVYIEDKKVFLFVLKEGSGIGISNVGVFKYFVLDHRAGSMGVASGMSRRIKGDKFDLTFVLSRGNTAFYLRHTSKGGLSGVFLGRTLRSERGYIYSSWARGPLRAILKTGVKREIGVFSRVRRFESLILIFKNEKSTATLRLNEFSLKVNRIALNLKRRGLVDFGFIFKKNSHTELTQLWAGKWIRLGIFVCTVNGKHTLYIANGMKVRMVDHASGYFLTILKRMGKFKLRGSLVYTKGYINGSVRLTVAGDL